MLLVEDVDVTREFYSFLLERQGYSVTAFGCGIDALKWVTTNEDVYDLALINFRLPDVPGSKVILEMVNCGSEVRTIALFTALDVDDPVVLRLTKEFSDLIDFRYVSKDPHSLLRFLESRKRVGISNEFRPVLSPALAGSNWFQRNAEVVSLNRKVGSV